MTESKEDLQPLELGSDWRYWVDKDQPQLVIRGKQAIDDHPDETGEIPAALANLSQPTFASKLIRERHSYRLA